MNNMNRRYFKITDIVWNGIISTKEQVVLIDISFMMLEFLADKADARMK